MSDKRNISKPVPGRPRRPSPPPSGDRAREPPTPNLLAHSLPSTATLNALPRLAGSEPTTPMTERAPFGLTLTWGRVEIEEQQRNGPTSTSSHHPMSPDQQSGGPAPAPERSELQGQCRTMPASKEPPATLDIANDACEVAELREVPIEVTYYKDRDVPDDLPYFFYGELARPEKLKEVLGLREVPALKKARVAPYQFIQVRGRQVLVDARGEGFKEPKPVVAGYIYEPKSEWEVEKLTEYHIGLYEGKFGIDQEVPMEVEDEGEVRRIEGNVPVYCQRDD
ncbi:hypothetical protein K469DRAFT_746631 [Zopfia rhizophila CBS 207.26]|uniref:Gamma-glutamylcyclotransferase AIG2-like domain-containing protein n=1 Tax=Zopfia rhizophila CBS 207.26 TaxID=1314779 RepID=A0A6A6EHR2_9PEZI|nr:hypothetical protein K469DRAFT_746631 [Zopfia rhizophila CBS 207.26]